jgi:hypothetical protein
VYPFKSEPEIGFCIPLAVPDIVLEFVNVPEKMPAV